MHSHRIPAFLFLVIFFLVALPAVAQFAPNGYSDEPGIPASTTAFNVENGFINLSDGNLHLEIPIGSYPQRGSTKSLRSRLVYDSRFWTFDPNTDDRPSGWQPNGVNIGPMYIASGWRLIAEGQVGRPSMTSELQVMCVSSFGQTQYKTKYSNYRYQEPDGTVHRFPLTLTRLNINCGFTSKGDASVLATDGSGFRADVKDFSIAAVYAPDGTKVFPRVEDTNGNFFTETLQQVPNVGYVDHVVDTLGREPVVTTISGNQIFLDYLNTQGTRSRMTVNVGTISAATNFGTGGEYTNPILNVINSIVLDNGSSYQFNVDSYGMITGITLPTGGHVTYGYTNTTAPNEVNRWVTSRTVDGNTWTFTPTYTACNAPCNPLSVTVTTPPYNDGTTTANNNSVYTFFTFVGEGAWNRQIQHFRGPVSGTPILTVTKDYNIDGPTSCPNPFPGVVVTRETVSWPTASGVLSKKSEYCYDANGVNLTSKKLWDFQPSGNFATTPDREIDNTYKTDPDYVGANMIDFLASTTVRDATGAQVAQTTYSYDQGTVQPSNITTQHGTHAGPRGNRTTISRWLNTNNSLVTSTATYFDTGLVFQQFDALGNPSKTLTYDPAFAGAYPTQECNALNQCKSTDYDVNTGLVTKITDENNKSTTFAYDRLFRLTGTSYPDGAATSQTYNDTLPNVSMSRSKLKTAGNWTSLDTTIYDSLGRYLGLVNADPEGNDYGNAQYDVLGHMAGMEDRYLLTDNPSHGQTQTKYDALGRVIQLIAQDGSTSSASYSANCFTTTDEAGKSRRRCRDAFGQLTEVDEPGDSSPGTAASGVLAVNGTLQSTSGATSQPGKGSVTLAGSEQSKSVVTQAAKAASGTVTIGGTEGSTTSDPCADQGGTFGPGGGGVSSCPQTTWDTGSVTVTINGLAKTANYGQFSTPATIATDLAGQFGSNATFRVTSSSNVLTVTAQTAGSAGNSITLSGGFYGDFSATASSGTLTGGSDSISTTSYDSGACTVSVNGTAYSTNFGQGDTVGAIASRLASTVTAGALATATASGGVLSLTAKQTGSATNYSLTSTCSYNSTLFSSPSFTATASGTTLTGGTDVGPAVYDSGTVTVTLGSFTASAPYSQSGNSTAAMVATALAGSGTTGLNRSGSPVTATASNGSLTITYKTTGVAGNGTITASSSSNSPGTFPSGSFSGSVSLNNGVDPVASSLDRPYVTRYQYDALGNVTCVHQKGMDTTPDKPCNDSTVPATWRPRNYTYDSLSRILSSTNPEFGTISYTYDNNGNVLTRTAPAPNQTGLATVTITYSYDVLNRLFQKSYSDGTTPSAFFTYDAPSAWGVPVFNVVGRLASAHTDQTVPRGESIFSYDAVGRVTMNDQCTPLNCGTSHFDIGYTYDLLGDLISYTTGVANVGFNQAFDSLGRVQQLTSNVVDAQHPATLATVDPTNGYFATSAIRKVTYGNGLTETAAYNIRLQPCRTNLNASGGALLNCGDAAPAGSVQDFQYGFSPNTNNGTVATFSGAGVQNFNRSYSYDSLNRLQSMSAPGDACNGLSWTYDAWANRTDQSATAVACRTFHSQVDTKNRLSSPGYQYDAAGNLTSDGMHSYTYDAENRLIKVDAGNTATYIYDAMGRRVEKQVGTVRTDYVYGHDGNVVTEYNNTCAAICWSVGYLYLHDKLIGEYKDGTTYFITKDHLGSSRLLTKPDKTTQESTDFLPYGEQIAGGNVTSHKFTSKERDPESGLDNFGARYYSSALGRFLSIDPASPNYEKPQTLNRYAYADNNPTSNLDPDGRSTVSAIYTLGRGSMDIWVREGEGLDHAQLLPSFGHQDLRPWMKSTGIGQSQFQNEEGAHNESVPNVGGCVMGCDYIYRAHSVGYLLMLTFSYYEGGDHKGEIKSVAVDLVYDSGASFIGAGDAARGEHTFLPGGGVGFPADVYAPFIDMSVIQTLDDKQLTALKGWSDKHANDPALSKVAMKIWVAVAEEQIRRQQAAEEKKKRDQRTNNTPKHGRHDKT